METAVRLRLLLASLALLSATPLASVSSSTLAQAEECTGENCTPPSSGSGKRDCESKKEQTVS